MTSISASKTKAAAREPQFSAMVVCGRYTELRLTHLISALKAVAPASAVGDWTGPFKAPPTDALGTNMLSIDGISLTLLAVDKPLPPSFFDMGPIPSQLMPNPWPQLRDHRAHVLVVPARLPHDAPTAVATARAVARLALAVASVVEAAAIKWVDSNNFIPASLFQRVASMLTPADGLALPLWIRLFAGRAHGGQRKVIVGSFGLWTFGLREIEYAPIDMPVQYICSHALTVCEQIFRTNNNVKPGDTVDADRQNVFKIDAVEQGFFGTGPVLQLSWLADAKSFDPSQTTQQGGGRA